MRALLTTPGLHLALGAVRCDCFLRSRLRFHEGLYLALSGGEARLILALSALLLRQARSGTWHDATVSCSWLCFHDRLHLALGATRLSLALGSAFAMGLIWHCLAGLTGLLLALSALLLRRAPTCTVWRCDWTVSCALGCTFLRAQLCGACAQREGPSLVFAMGAQRDLAVLENFACAFNECSWACGDPAIFCVERVLCFTCKRSSLPWARNATWAFWKTWHAPSTGFCGGAT
jgi:hypothetical protein